ncbi:hypothetical protein G6F50_016830 [Rhizopus delemar]|uniref:Uncharacterized protein n=1 Tax=Rhizopus delemar TaxID=936053 RepID=A0A9P6XS23_9FUNG|nr:hypothetical protein G6F50_016830 [Rhizopus delemar]
MRAPPVAHRAGGKARAFSLAARSDVESDLAGAGPQVTTDVAARGNGQVAALRPSASVGPSTVDSPGAGARPGLNAASRPLPSDVGAPAVYTPKPDIIRTSGPGSSCRSRWPVRSTLHSGGPRFES